MARNYSNIALDTTLTAGIAAGDLTCVVASATGWPSVPFAAVLDPGSLTIEEVVQVTLKVGTTFTITRGFDGTTASAHALGATVRHSAIAGDFTDLQAADLLLTPMARTLTINGVAFDLSANRAWTISPGAGTVTSVALTVPGVLFSVAGSPVTTSGTLALSLLTQTANTVLAGPVSGGAATPTMRSLVVADLPLVTPLKGGTGIANADTNTLTLGAATTISGGGTLALGGFTLTVPKIGTAVVGTGANTRIGYWSSANDLTSSANLLWDNTNGFLGVGVTPTQTIHAVMNNGEFKFSRGASNVTPSITAVNTTVGSKAVGVGAGTNFSFFAYDNTGYFAIISEAKTAFTGDTIGSGGLRTIIDATGHLALNPPTGAASWWMEMYNNPAVTPSAGLNNFLYLNMRNSGTPAAGFGLRIALALKSSTTNDRMAATWDGTWATATDASRKARIVGTVYDTAEREWIRGEASGTAAMVSLYGGAAVTQKAAITAPAGGAIIDAEARVAIGLILTALGAAAGGIGITA